MEIWLTLAVALGVFVLFISQKVDFAQAALMAGAALLGTGIISTNEMLGVFSNSAAMTVAAMFVLCAALEKTGVIDLISKIIIRISYKAPKAGITLLFTFSFFCSFFINNTSIVIVLTPVVIAVSRSIKMPSSRFLIPLSYVSIMGGACTLVGTSTNLLVNSELVEMGQPSFGMFDLTLTGLAMATVGTIYLFTIGMRRLPNRQNLSDMYNEGLHKKFISQVLIPEKSPFIGKKVRDIMLPDKKGITVLQIIPVHQKNEENSTMVQLSRGDLAQLLRRKTFNVHSAPDYIDRLLETGDRLVIIADQQRIMEADADKSLSLVAGEEIGNDSDSAGDDETVMEGVVAPGSVLVGRTLKQINQSVMLKIQILAVHRNSGIDSDFERVRISVGDTLLLRGSEEDLHRLMHEDDLINLTVPMLDPYKRNKAPLAILGIVGAIGLATSGVLPIAGSAMLGAVFVVATGCLQMHQVYKSLHGEVLLLIYGMLMVSVALKKTGALALAVTSAVEFGAGLPPIMMLSLLYLLTSVLTETLSNNAVAVVLTPVAVALAQQLGVNPAAFAAAVMFGASSSFATPVGYQTNTLVFNAGGYKFSDFIKVGVPMNLIMWVMATILIPIFWPL